MGRAKKDLVKANFSIKSSVFNLLTEFCNKTGRTKTGVVELALEQYIEAHKSEMEQDTSRIDDLNQ